jgi:hypothetical protein
MVGKKNIFLYFLFVTSLTAIAGDQRDSKHSAQQKESFNAEFTTPGAARQSQPSQPRLCEHCKDGNGVIVNNNTGPKNTFAVDASDSFISLNIHERRKNLPLWGNAATVPGNVVGSIPEQVEQGVLNPFLNAIARKVTPYINYALGDPLNFVPSNDKDKQTADKLYGIAEKHDKTSPSVGIAEAKSNRFATINGLPGLDEKEKFEHAYSIVEMNKLIAARVRKEDAEFVQFLKEQAGKNPQPEKATPLKPTQNHFSDIPRRLSSEAFAKEPKKPTFTQQ